MAFPIAPFWAPVVVVAGGPSLTLAQVRHIAMAHAGGRCHVITVNDAVYPCWFADIAYASDRTWWERHHGVRGFRGMKACLETKEGEVPPFADVRMVRKGGNEGFCDEPGMITSGGNSGHAAVHLAATLGADEIILVAFDFTGDSRGCVVDHWFGQHEGDLYKENSSQEQTRLQAFRRLTVDLRERGVEVKNASLRSKIDWLPWTGVATL